MRRANKIVPLKFTALSLFFLAIYPAATAETMAKDTLQDLGDLELEDLMELRVERVYSASKYEQKVTQAPSSVSIVTADEIKKLGHRTFADLLSGVRGLYVSNDRNYSYLGLRGFLRPGDYNTRILVLVDGHRMNDNIYDAAYFGHENTLDLDMIERVEIIRGPSSSIYGSSAFFGVINIITKRGIDYVGAETSFEAGSFDTYKGRFRVEEHFKNGVEIMLSGSFYHSNGQSKLYFPEFDQRINAGPHAGNNGIARNSDAEEAYQFFGSLRFKAFTLSGFFSSRDKTVPTASFGTVFNDGGEITTDKRAYADLKFDHHFSSDSQLQARIYLDRYAYYGAYPYNWADAGDPPIVYDFRDEIIGEWAGAELQWTRRMYNRHTFIAGGEYRANVRQYQASYEDTSPPILYGADDRTSNTLGLFTQAEIGLTQNLVLNAGVRYDNFSGSVDSTINPRFALIHNPWESGTFKILYGKAFRAPNVYEQYYYIPQTTFTPLEPETIRTYEVVYEQYFTSKYRLSLSAYQYQTKNLISLTSNEEGDLAFINIASAEAEGAELEVEARFDSGTLIRGSYTIQRTEDQNGAELTSSPRHQVKLSFIAPLLQELLFAGIEVQYQSKAITLQGNHADSFIRTNLTLFSQELAQGWEASLGIYNLFDERITYPGSQDHLQDVILQDGRSFRLKLTYKF